MSIFKRHPFPIAAYFKQSLVLTFALTPKVLADMLPPPLQLDTFEDRYAFVAVAMVQTEALRPKGLPAWMGNNFFLAGYRIFVRYTNNQGKNLRGLYILESQTDRRAYSFGVFHFLPYKEWYLTFSLAGFGSVEEQKLTPFLTTFTLTKNVDTP